MTKQEALNIVADFTEKAVLAGLREGVAEGDVLYVAHHATNAAILQFRAEKQKEEAGH